MKPNHLKPQPRKSDLYNVVGKSPCTVDQKGVACKPVRESAPVPAVNSAGKQYVTSANAAKPTDPENDPQAESTLDPLPQEALSPMMASKPKAKYQIYTNNKKRIPIGPVERSKAIARLLKKNFPDTYFKIHTDFKGRTTQSSITWDDDSIAPDAVVKLMPECEHYLGKKKVILLGLPPFHYVSESLFKEHMKTKGKVMTDTKKPTLRENLTRELSQSINGMRIFPGSFTDLTINESGDLTITLHKEGREFIHYNNLLQEPVNQAFKALLQEHTNSDWSFPDPEALGAINDTVLMGYGFNASSAPTLQESRVFAYADYRVSSEIDEMMLHGKVQLKGSPVEFKTETRILSELDVKKYELVDMDSEINTILEKINIPAEKGTFAALLINENEIWGIKHLVPAKNEPAYKIL